MPAFPPFRPQSRELMASPHISPLLIESDPARPQKANRLDAHRSALEGGLPSNILHDDTLLRSEGWKPLFSYYRHGAFAREYLAYPRSYGTFAPGKDIVDEQTGARLPYSEVCSLIDPSQVFGVENVGLFVDPLDVVPASPGPVIVPRSIVVVTPFIQEFGVPGLVDEKTRIPIDIGLGANPAGRAQDDLDPPPAENLRWMYRFEGQGVRPIVRYIQDFRRGIFTLDWTPGAEYAVGVARE